jgi:hypothetical protein
MAGLFGVWRGQARAVKDQRCSRGGQPSRARAFAAEVELAHSRFGGNDVVTTTLLQTPDGVPFFDSTAASASGVNPGPSAAASAIETVLAALNSASAQWAIKNKFESIKPSLNATISAWETDGCYVDGAGGCVVEILLSRWDGPISTSPVYSFVDMFGCSCGLDFQSALNETLSQGSIVPSGPDGGVLVVMYIWYKVQD